MLRVIPFIYDYSMRLVELHFDRYLSRINRVESWTLTESRRVSSLITLYGQFKYRSKTSLEETLTLYNLNCPLKKGGI